MTNITDTQTTWTPDSWKAKPIKQDVKYEDQAKFKKSVEKLTRLPPLVTPGEVETLKEQLKQAALGKAFLLQGGDCAELFDYCSATPIENKLKVLIQMSLVLLYGSRVPVIRMARMAGQYAKPRSSPYETVNGEQVLSFRGDNVNGYELSERQPDPDRLVQAYFHSAATLNYVRGLISSGLADLNSPSSWDLSHVRSSSVRSVYQNIVNRIHDTLDFMKTIGAVDTKEEDRALKTVDLFMSHEGLMLDYEAALTRYSATCSQTEKKWYNLSTHFIWVGDRTRQLDGAHIEYLSGIANPIGIKVGPTTVVQDLLDILDKLNPSYEVGKITLITRFGHNRIEDCLPKYIHAINASPHKVVWVCDPMHGNTEMSSAGVKTRHFSNIMAEVGHAFRIHQKNDSILNGVHFELTGESVTECVGGSMELDHCNLNENYQTYCDPRMNYEQSMDMAFLLSKYYQKQRNPVKEL